MPDFDARGYSTSGLGSAVMSKVGADEAESASRIRDGIGQAEQASSMILEAIESLSRRLDTVLSPTPPSTLSANKPSATIAPYSHLCERVNMLNETLSGAEQRLRELRRRVEV